MFSPQPPPLPSPSPSVSASAGPAVATVGAAATASTAGGRVPPSTAEAEAVVATGPRPPKRIRLSLACNQCRKRKVRCDASEPRCRNCVTRNEACETTNLRNSGPAVRHWPAKDGQGLPAGAAAPGPREPVPSPVSQSRFQPPEPPLSLSSASPLSSSSSRGPRRIRTNSLSWLSRAYRAQEAEGGGGASNHHASSPPELVVNTDDDRAKVKVSSRRGAHGLPFLISSICRVVNMLTPDVAGPSVHGRE